MNSINIRKLDIMSFNEQDWQYDYRELFSICTEKKLNKVSDDISTLFANLVNSWNKDLNSQWTVRTYLSTKMILNATVLLKQREFAHKSNLRTVIPYLEYYTILSLLRGVAFMLPEQDWKDGKLIEISHSKAINLTCGWIARFDKKLSDEIEFFCHELKALRELISYKAPASGDINLARGHNIEMVSTLLAELAQFNSEILEPFIKYNTSITDHVLLQKHIDQVCNIKIGDFIFFDKEDSYRLNYILRKQSRPSNLQSFMTEGQVEDFIGAWDTTEYEEGSDEYLFYSGSPATWQDIFDVP